MAPSSRFVEMGIYSSMYKSTGFVSFAEYSVIVSDVAWVKILEFMSFYFSSRLDPKITRQYMRLHDNSSIPAGMTLDGLRVKSKDDEFHVEGIGGVGGKVEASERFHLSDAHRSAELILPSATTNITYMSFSYSWSDRNVTHIEGHLHALTAMPPLLP